MNVELALTPRTDYPQLAEMLPWCMEQAGYSQYVDALKAAIDDAKFTAVEAPAELPEGAGTVRLVYPDKELAANGGVAILLLPEDGSDWLTAYPLGEDAIVTAIVPAGDYTILEARGTIQDPSFRIATNDGWVALVGEAAYQPERSFHVEAGEVIELTAEGL